MQLISKNLSREQCLETEPILRRSNAGQSNDEGSGCEIRVVTFGCSSSDVDENVDESNVSLVIEDSPQCRICLDAEGLDSFSLIFGSLYFIGKEDDKSIIDTLFFYLSLISI